MEGRDGALWIGTDGGGLNRLDGTGRFTHYRHDPDDPATIGADAVFGLTEGRDGAVWVGTWDGGLSRLDPNTGRVTRFRHDADDPRSVVSDNIWKLLVLQTGEILVTTPDGVDLLDPRHETFRRLASVYPEVGSLQTGTAAEDAAGNLWLGTRLQGVQRIERSSGRVTAYRHDPDDPESLGPGWVSAIHLDEEGNAWFGTEGGLGCLPRGASRIRRFTSADGLPADDVVSILEDDSGSLWLGTPRGLSRFVDAVHLPEEPEFVNYGIHDGLQGLEFAADAALRTSDGLLYFGGERGLSFFDPAEIRVNLEPPPVVLTDLRIFNESVVPGAPGSPLKRSITEAEELTLSRDHAVVTF
jgi:ligand-binding sensor domain-containing protein